MLGNRQGLLVAILLSCIVSFVMFFFLEYKPNKATGKITMKGKTEKTYHLELRKQTDLELDSVTYYNYYKMKSNRDRLYTSGPDYYFYINDKDIKVSKDDYYKYKIGTNYSNE